MAYLGNFTTDGAVRVSASLIAPSVQTVDGTVDIGNFPATQPVSAVSLPLPAGAATAANQLPNNHQVQVSNPQTTVGISDGANLDAFSRLRVSQPVQLFQTQVQYDLDPIDMEGGATGTGSAPSYLVDNRVAVLSAAAGSGTSYFQSYQYIQYQPGKSQLVFITFTLRTAVQGATKEVGYFDANDGVFVRQTEDGDLEIVLRSSTSGIPDDRVATQSFWNIDKLDGTGVSGVTFDVTKSQILVIDLQYLGHGRVRVGFDINGAITYAHEFLNANLIEFPYMRTAALPVQALLTANATIAVSTMLFKCASVNSEGGDSGNTYVPAVVVAIPKILQTAASGTRTHVISIRPRLLFNSEVNRSTGVIEGVNILNKSANECFYEICHGAAFTVAPTFADVNTTFSAFEYGTGGTFGNLTNGLIVYSGFLVGNIRGAEGGTSFQEFLPCTLDRAGAHRNLGTWTLLAQGIGGAVDLEVSLRLREFR